ncbi:MULTISPECIES: hypothetical protein [unclassified Variovorax]|uniref:hypothetical protein n=1 Tax=unclassified Variovorax TaxID=663243 RepID=UPI0025758C4F|nr:MULTISPECIES: hypothetical protein [unclassified Variovorax]MDM0086758.1 hypothetical protein [Variovorax sp. J22G40]MDM0144986.1 hypothetical protein [Variovorax sp. J2P1-31]
MTNAQIMLTKYLEAEVAVLSGKSIAFNGRTLTNENLTEIRRGRKEWEARVASESGRGCGLGGLSFSVARFDGERG